jgi:hypothetical protein
MFSRKSAVASNSGIQDAFMSNHGRPRPPPPAILFVASISAAVFLGACGMQEQPTVPEKVQGDEGPELNAERDRSAIEADVGASVRATEAPGN